jgi:hypothetical protein
MTGSGLGRYAETWPAPGFQRGQSGAPGRDPEYQDPKTSLLFSTPRPHLLHPRVA